MKSSPCFSRRKNFEHFQRLFSRPLALKAEVNAPLQTFALFETRLHRKSEAAADVAVAVSTESREFWHFLALLLNPTKGQLFWPLKGL